MQPFIQTEVSMYVYMVWFVYFQVAVGTLNSISRLFVVTSTLSYIVLYTLFQIIIYLTFLLQV
jgi:hypothetical protein